MRRRRYCVHVESSRPGYVRSMSARGSDDARCGGDGVWIRRFVLRTADELCSGFDLVPPWAAPYAATLTDCSGRVGQFRGQLASWLATETAREEFHRWFVPAGFRCWRLAETPWPHPTPGRWSGTSGGVQFVVPQIPTPAPTQGTARTWTCDDLRRAAIDYAGKLHGSAEEEELRWLRIEINGRIQDDLNGGGVCQGEWRDSWTPWSRYFQADPGSRAVRLKSDAFLRIVTPGSP